MQIINTSNGPAILDDNGTVILPADTSGMRRVLAESPTTVVELVEAMDALVQQSDSIIAKVKALEPLTPEESKVLDRGQISHMNIYNVSLVIDGKAEGH